MPRHEVILTAVAFAIAVIGLIAVAVIAVPERQPDTAFHAEVGK